MCAPETSQSPSQPRGGEPDPVLHEARSTLSLMEAPNTQEQSPLQTLTWPSPISSARRLEPQHPRPRELNGTESRALMCLSH